MGDKSGYRAENWDIMQYLMGEFNDHQLHGAVYFDGRVDESALGRAAELSFRALPQLCCRFEMGGGRPCWQPIECEIGDIVSVVPADDIEAALQSAMVKRLDTLHGPQVKIDIVRGPDADALCVVMNHMLCDGAAFKEYLYLLGDLYSGAENLTSPGDRSVRQVFRALSGFQKWTAFCQNYHLSNQNGGVEFPMEGGDKPFIALHRIGCGRFDAVRYYVKRRGATVNDALLTAYLRALLKTLGHTPAEMPCAVDLRKYLPERKAQGFCNLTSYLFCGAQPLAAEGFSETLGKVMQSMKGQKKSLACLHASLLLEAAFALLPYPLAVRAIRKAFDNPPLAMTNIGAIDDRRLRFGDTRVKDAFVTGSVKYKPYFQLAATTFSGRMTLSVNLYGTETDRERVQDFLEAVDRQFDGCL